MIIRHDLDPKLYLLADNQYPSVFNFFGTDGLGTLISSRWAITAAHTAKNIPSSHQVLIAEKRYSIEQVVLHPDFQGSKPQDAQNDIALVELIEPVLGVEPIIPYQHDDELGQVATFVGRGDFGTGRTGIEKSDGLLRMATNRVERVDEQWIVFRFDEPPETTELEGVSGIGDSGGPALIKTEAGLFIAGISSWQDDDEQGQYGLYGVWEYYARVSKYIDWISDTTNLIY
ncbi:trypsin-like serine protease [Nostoc sp. CHAB 5844]|nr:trypsin-like serine protease [Nostoc sp. CHAB 5844]